MINEDEFAQLLVGAALTDRRFLKQLLHDRRAALASVTEHVCAPPGVTPTEADWQSLGTIRARNLAEFALGVERRRAARRTARPRVGGGAAAQATAMVETWAR